MTVSEMPQYHYSETLEKHNKLAYLVDEYYFEKGKPKMSEWEQQEKLEKESKWRIY